MANETLARGDCTIAWERFAAGREAAPPLVFLHGFGMERRAMADLAHEISARGLPFPAIGMDLRGHGATRAPARDDAYGYPQMRDDLLALLDRVAPTGAHLVGHSMGGQVALTAALLRPTGIHSLSLFGAGACRAVDDPSERHSWERAAAAFENGSPWRLAASLAAAAPTRDATLTPDRLYGRARGADLARVIRGGFLHVTGNEEACASLEVPALLLVGDADTGWLEPTRRLAAGIPGARLRVFEGAGHLLHLERPGPCAEEVATFLEGLS